MVGNTIARMSRLKPNKSGPGPGDTPRISDCRLPSGMVVAQINAWETLALYKEIFDGRCYVQRGIAIPAGSTIVDVGANIGLATLFFHREVPTARIVSIEPASLPRLALETNVERFGVPATVIAAALGRERGRRQFSFYPGHTISSGLYAEVERDATNVERFLRLAGTYPTQGTADRSKFRAVEPYECDVKTLAEVVESAGADAIGLLKLDAEGAEDEILASMPPDLWSIVSQVVLEVHGGSERARDLAGLLRAHGMVVSCRQDVLAAGRPESTLHARRPE